MPKKAWLYIGLSFGLVIPTLLNIGQRFGLWQQRPSAYFLFRPGLLILAPFDLIHGVGDFALVLGLVFVAANAVAFGAAAYGLRKYFLILIALLSAISYLSLPPHDAKLERRFEKQKPEFEALIRKASMTPSVVRISESEVEASDGKKYKWGERTGSDFSRHLDGIS